MEHERKEEEEKVQRERRNEVNVEFSKIICTWYYYRVLL